MDRVRKRFGSTARVHGEEPHEESDIDVIVLTRGGEVDRSRVWRAALESGDARLEISPITTTRNGSGNGSGPFAT